MTQIKDIVPVELINRAGTLCRQSKPSWVPK